ncbi:hypothetical protein F5146DRAFT_1073172 [Armillaria mellea]|nr:hypothetical protein F5146DRAFT_1073172 [Armillaria mellea]
MKDWSTPGIGVFWVTPSSLACPCKGYRNDNSGISQPPQDVPDRFIFPTFISCELLYILGDRNSGISPVKIESITRSSSARVKNIPLAHRTKIQSFRQADYPN